YTFTKLKLPSLIGMLIAGIILGPYALNLIDHSILNISSELRQIALIIILTRAGLSLDIRALKKVGRSAIFMCFLPACFEITAMLFFAPKILGISKLDALIMGSVVAAVSPAVIVPRMIKLMETEYGTNKSIPQLIMASASIDDVFVIVLFTSFISLATGDSVSLLNFAQIPIAIILGIFIGIFIGWILSIFFKKVHIRDTIKVVIILSISFLLVTLEKAIEHIIPFSGLLAVMSVGIATLRFYPVLAKRMSVKFSKLWVVSEILLFVLVGATVDISFAITSGGKAILLLIIVLIFRMISVFICLLGTELNKKERLFCMIAYIPKATVQAGIGGIPLSMGLACGKIVLTVAVLSIIITAPLGAFGIDLTYKKWLSCTKDK
ncbi:MAG: cation:proton antiporter, partial [Eubacteriales bacterium]|nr:cation:proton antiporter [Eubacteriales bacterium]